MALPTHTYTIISPKRKHQSNTTQPKIVFMIFFVAEADATMGKPATRENKDRGTQKSRHMRGGHFQI